MVRYATFVSSLTTISHSYCYYYYSMLLLVLLLPPAHSPDSLSCKYIPPCSIVEGNDAEEMFFDVAATHIATTFILCYYYYYYYYYHLHTPLIACLVLLSKAMVRKRCS